MNPLGDPEDLDEATRTINQYAQSDWCDVSYSEHALQRIEERVFPNDLIILVLRTGNVVGVRSDVIKDRKRWRYEVELVDQYGRATVITAIPGRFKLHIVSAYTDVPD